MNFVFRIDRMGTKVEIRGLAQGDDKIYRFERTTKDVVDSKNLPVRITIRDGQEDRNDLVDKLRKMFVSDQAIAGMFPSHIRKCSSGLNTNVCMYTDILHDLKRHIIQKLIPKLQQEGYVEVAEAEETANSERRAQESRNPNPLYRPGNNQPNPHNPVPFSPAPDLARPRRGAPVGDFPPPDFEDEYEINRPPGGGLVMPGRPPLNIGHDDLNPPGLGPHDPLRGSFVPGGIPGGLPRPGGGSGMHPSFDDPLFTGQGGHGGFGQPGFDPQVPPGARWDPTGPQGGPRFPPGGGGGFYGMGRGNGPHGFGGGDII